MNRKRSFDPVVNEKVELLILGSLPGDASLAQNQYYAHPQNQFWRLMAEVIGVPLPMLDYQTRLTALLENRIGLWDVIAEAHRTGSLDSNIHSLTSNNLISVVNNLPHLSTIAFNGGTAARLGLKTLKDKASHYQVITLPSSSPAHTMPYLNKLIAWRSLQKLSA
ncbi:DNA-deoxyinosine glycosylase [Collimonas pratensis]|uniref:DNA-deoxyinosine glycosylase n=1 Tax=Collimonas pratensis TaxID=279113 RepID=UPI00143E0487|nr:DNA-deoxyinosine glycosylase [Collimonas pratensis]NKI69011.1 DNA-deoxyinosine glycosylase [Collimonas pratensis]